MVKREKANYLIQSVSHSIDVLEELAKAGGEVGVTELSKRLKLHKNNVFRLLATLELRGYVEQNSETEDYRLGVKTLQLGQAYLIQSPLAQKAFPVLKKLSEETGETVSLAILQGDMVQYPISIESKRPVRVTARIATSVLAKQCATGRLLTAQLGDVALQEILSTNTPQDAAIRNQLAELRSTGSIVDKGAIEPDIVTISQVIEGRRGTAVAAVEITVPQYRARIENLAPSVSEAVTLISQTIGSQKSGLIASIEKEITTVKDEQGMDVAMSNSALEQAGTRLR